MSHQPTPSRNLSEIGHLFLSSVRERQTAGAALPRRQPPGASARATLSVPAQPRMDVQTEVADDAPREAAVGSIPEAAAELRFPAVTAIVGGHLNGNQADRAREYARHLAAAGQRVGLIEVDASEF